MTTIHHRKFWTQFYSIILLMGTFLMPASIFAQQNYTISLDAIDGIQITPDNIFNYRISAAKAERAQVRGAIRYKGAAYYLEYQFDIQLQAGMNSIDVGLIHPQWKYSSSAIKDLFVNYKMLPEGTFEYCVTVMPANSGPEVRNLTNTECLYYRPTGLFLINLITPENKAKLKEFYPQLSWVANYSVSNNLTYRIRIAEIKEGQNPVNAVLRNPSVYSEKSLTTNSLIYPIYAKPLRENQPYAWTVDAYYNDVLLGGSETWQFIIPSDTPKTKYPAVRSYIDIKRENPTATIYILGELKLKYELDKYRKENLRLSITDENREPIKILPEALDAVYGDNRYILNLKDSCNLKHLKKYMLTVTTGHGESHELSFKYLNPDFEK